MNKLFILMSLIILSSCGKKEVPEGMTRVIFKSGDEKSIQSYSLNKGLIVYGRNLDLEKTGAGFGNNIGNFISSNSEVILPNGRYKFFAAGYDDVGTPGNDAFHANSQFFCGDGNGGQEVTLNGSVVTVSIALSNASQGVNCSDIFASSGFRTPGVGQFKSLSITFCDSSGTSAGACVAGTVAGVSSAEIKITAYDKLKNNTDFDFSKAVFGCLSVTGGLLNLGTKIPLRNDFHLSIKTFASGNCTGAPANVYDFPQGIEGGTFDANPNRTYINTTSTINLYLKQP